MIHAKMGAAVHPPRIRFARSKKYGFPEEAFRNFFAQLLAWVFLAAPELLGIIKFKTLNSKSHVTI